MHPFAPREQPTQVFRQRQLEVEYRLVRSLDKSLDYLVVRERFQTLGLSAYDAAAVTASLEIARYYEGTLKVAGNAQAKVSANWIMGELSARLNREGLDIEAAPVRSEQLGGLIARIADQTISNAIAKKVFDALWQGQGKSADEIIEADSHHAAPAHGDNKSDHAAPAHDAAKPEAAHH
ncbi:MAG: hypothetical protein EBV95_05230 [Actinobacteria bacterium]|nr:hypothetical protein [Actinomycetota bacterium]